MGCGAGLAGSGRLLGSALGGSAGFGSGRLLDDFCSLMICAPLVSGFEVLLQLRCKLVFAKTILDGRICLMREHSARQNKMGAEPDETAPAPTESSCSNQFAPDAEISPFCFALATIVLA